jgi:F-type H+-transporting ATPase subunit epsilon
MQVDIITPDSTLFSGEAESITLPGSAGNFQILNNHAPIVSSLSKGNVVVKSAKGVDTITISGGVVEASNNKVIVLA